VVATNASDKGLPFAVKFFLRGNEERRKGFLREIDYLKAHPHESILPIHDWGTSPQGFPFYVSRYMATTLKRIIASDGASMLDKLLYASQMSSALNYLAKATPQILHCDLKAANIFVNGRACLLGDFGMMQSLGTGTVDKNMPFEARTPDMVRYLAGGAAPTTQSDVFALGVVLYRLFTGEEPLVTATNKTDPVRMNALYSTGGRHARALDDVLRRMLDDDPALRPRPDALLDVMTSLVVDEASRRSRAVPWAP
jgi:serine/threonine protein kinase